MAPLRLENPFLRAARGMFRVNVGIVVVGSLIIGIGITSHFTTRSLIESSDWVSRTYEIVARLELVTARLMTAEMHHRAFLVTQRSGYLADYR